MINFNVSYSLMSLYKTSPLQFYFAKIAKMKGEQINTCYGDAGNVVHHALEERINNFGNHTKKFEEEWERFEIPERGMFGEVIDKKKYIAAFNYGLDMIDIWNDDYNLKAEEKIEFKLTIDNEKITIKGIIDVVAKHKETNQVVLLDWKTNSSLGNNELSFIQQSKFYSYLYYKKYGVIPSRCLWCMLKTGQKVDNSFTLEDIKEVEEKIKKFVREVREKGDNINNYELGDWKNIFNPYKDLCEKEIDKRTLLQFDTEIRVERRGNNLVLTEMKDTRFLRGLDIKFSYLVDGYMFSDLYKKKIWDGKKHVFSMKKKILAIGLKDALEEYVEDYNEKFETKYKIKYINKQDKEILDKKYQTTFIPHKFPLREYQNEAVQIALDKKIGIINLPTGVGKSIVIAELIKKINKRTMVIVSRIELLKQLQEDIEEWLGVPVAKMSSGELVINKQFTICSIQTLNAILKRKDESSKLLQKYLYNVGTVIFDEAHQVRNANMYNIINRNCVNTEYIIGTTATDWRNDCHTLLMNAAVGMTIYKKTPQEMEKAGWILPTKCYFINNDCNSEGDYASAYKNVIVHSQDRNKMIKYVCEKFYKNYKILIITKLIDHGKILNQMIDNSYLINSHTKKNDRAQWFKDFKSETGTVLIGSQQIFAQGINIPALDIIINVGAHVSNVVSIQVVGRVKRTNAGRKMSYFIDFYDSDDNYFEKASNERMNILKEFGNEIIMVDDLDKIIID